MRKVTKVSKYNPTTGTVEVVEEVQHDFCPFGGEAHQILLGLRLAEKGDFYTHEGADGKVYSFLDASPWLSNPGARREWILEVLASRVRELLSVPAVPQNAPLLFVPD